MNTLPAIWLNGRPSTELPLPDRAVDYGDGLFETLLLRGGTPLFVELHLQRLERGLATLGFPACSEQAAGYLAAACAELGRWGWSWVALRITVTRGSGPRGYAPPEEASPRFIVTASPLERDGGAMLPPAGLARAEIRWPSQPQLAGLKHLNRLEQVLAAATARQSGQDEALMLDQRGRPVSVSSGNLFAVCGGRLITPPLAECGIAGTRRRLVLERWAPAIGLAAEESTLTLEELLGAEEVFYTNSLVGLRPVASLEHRCWHRHGTCRALFDCYAGSIG